MLLLPLAQASVSGADPDVWRYQFHTEVWLILAAAVGLALSATRVIGPKVVPAGEPVVSSRQKRTFLLALFLLWVASDWPMHDISEEYLYFVHMIQHMMISFIIPPLFLLSMPEWLARLIVSGDGGAGVWIRRLTRPVAAGFLFNFIVAITHLTQIVNFSVENGPFHYGLHLVVFFAAMLMWVPVVSPLPELRISIPGQLVYLFLMSILPTVPGAFLTFAENPIYETYDHAVRVWGLTAEQDQQSAGVVMKLGGGALLWSIIFVKFFRWASSEVDADHRQVRSSAHSGPDGNSSGPVLTYDDVSEAFDRAGPAPSEHAS